MYRYFVSVCVCVSTLVLLCKCAISGFGAAQFVAVEKTDASHWVEINLEVEYKVHGVLVSKKGSRCFVAFFRYLILTIAIKLFSNKIFLCKRIDLKIKYLFVLF